MPASENQVFDHQPIRALPPQPDFDGVNDETIHPSARVKLAANFETSKEWHEAGRSLGLSDEALRVEEAKFRAYWTLGKGAGTKRTVKGWGQTWINWISKVNQRSL